jgi:chromosome segregation ATPase
VAGLLVAISAKNSSVDEQKVVDEVTAQLKQELTGVSGALKAADRIQKQEAKAAARDRARIRRAVTKVEAEAKARLRKLTSRVASLEEQASKADAQNARLRKQVNALTQGQIGLVSEVAAINRRLRNLSKNGGT